MHVRPRPRRPRLPSGGPARTSSLYGAASGRGKDGLEGGSARPEQETWIHGNSGGRRSATVEGRPCCASGSAMSGLRTGANSRTNLARCFRCYRDFNTVGVVIAVEGYGFVDAVLSLSVAVGRNRPGNCHAPWLRSDPARNPWLNCGPPTKKGLRSRCPESFCLLGGRYWT